MTLTSTVQATSFTSSGHQWTTIDGVRYVTFWDVKTKDWQTGERVSFEAFSAPLWSGNPSIPHAKNIRKAV